MSSFFEGDKDNEDEYSNSILLSTQINETDDLIDTDLMNLLGYIRKLRMPTDLEIASKAIEFGQFTRMKTLVFDLDETLIHSQLILPGKEDDTPKDFEIHLSNGGRYGIKIRPYVEKCLAHLSQYYEMAIFTAAE